MTKKDSPASKVSQKPEALRASRRRVSLSLALYIGKEVLKVSLLVFIILEVIHGSLLTVKAVRDHGFDLVLFFPVFWRTFAYALYHSIPIALLFGTSLVFGRLVADREVSAFRSFGLSHLELLIAPFVLGLFFATGGISINGYLVPELRFANRNIGKLVLDQLQYLGDGWNKTINLDRKNSIHIQRHQGHKLYGISIFAEKPELIGFEGLWRRMAEEEGDEDVERVQAISFPFVLYAAEGEVMTAPDDTNQGRSSVYLEIRGIKILVDHDVVETGKSSDFLTRWKLDRWRIPIALDDRKRGHKDMPNPMLEAELKVRLANYTTCLKENPSDEAACERVRREYINGKVDYYKRYSFAAISLTFPLTAALLALLLNSTNRLLPFFIAVTVNCVIFFPLESQSNKLALASDLPFAPFLFAHLGNFVLVLLVVTLCLWLEYEHSFVSSRRSRHRRWVQKTRDA